MRTEKSRSIGDDRCRHRLQCMSAAERGKPVGRLEPCSDAEHSRPPAPRRQPAFWIDSESWALYTSDIAPSFRGLS
jgi:hypothetical protein